MDSILFVCLGNICRSPAAEAVLRAKAARGGLQLMIDSAGTGGWHAGEPPHPPMIAAAARRGYDLAPLRARQLVRADFDRFGHVLVMDRANLRDAERLRAGRGTAPALFLPLAPQLGTDEVPDPWYTGDFDGTLDLIEAATDALIERLKGA